MPAQKSDSSGPIPPVRQPRNGAPALRRDQGRGPGLPPVRRTRAGATWVGLVVAAVVLVLLVVFMLQNTEPVEVTFFGLRGSAPLALTLLIAGLGVGLIALVVGSVRITQLRHRTGADRRSAAP